MLLAILIAHKLFKIKNKFGSLKYLTTILQSNIKIESATNITTY